jgi:hypothetical protein
MTKNTSTNLQKVLLHISLLATLLLVMPLSRLHAQGAGNASIQGSVTDATGAVIPGATVTLTDMATRVKRTVTSDSSGQYVFPDIPVSTYSLDVAVSGFQSYTRTNIVMEVGSAISANVVMTVGSADQKIEVKSEGLALQTEDASFKQTIDHQTVTQMPLNGRQMTGLITLSGGSTQAPAGDFTGSKYTYQTISVSIAGGMGNTTMWRLDGGSNNDYMANGNLPFPFPDAVSQFSVESSALSAQNGMHTGGLVNVVTRSGTNHYHGDAFWFVRNNYINASNFFSATKDTLHQNQYGGTFGGPILKDKLFAFAGYQRSDSKQSQASVQGFVPTAANLNGDFSTTDGPNCTSSGKFVQLVDPLTGAKLVNNIYPTKPTYNAQSLKLLSYLPAIDPSIDTSNCGLVKYSIPLQTADNSFVTRVDWTINPKNNLYGRYFIDGFQQPAFFYPTNILVTTQAGLSQRVQSFTLGEAYTINPRIVNTAHITLLRRRNNRGYAANNINATTLGVTLWQGQPNGLQLTTSNKFTIGGGTNSNSKFNDNSFAFDDNVTMLFGKHQFVFGGEYVRNQLNIANAYETNGVFGFDGRYSLNGPGGGSAGGDPNLDFLMGTQGTFQQSKQQQNALRGPIPSLYFQDTYHANQRLTLVGGIRWSPNFMPFDYFHRGVEFSNSAFLANQHSTVYPNAPAGALYYGDPGVSKIFTQNSPWQFSPNFGVSFDPTGNGRTVIRGGAEIAFDQVNFFTAQRNQQNPPYATAISQLQTSTSGPISFSSPWSAGSVTTSPFPQPQVPDPATAQFFAQSQYIVMPTHFKPSYSEQWTASIQHQLPKDWQLQFQYVGSHTVHAPMGTPLSAAIYVPGVWGTGGTGCTGVVTTGPAGKPAGAAGTPCSTVANQAQRFALTVANPLQGNGYLGGGGGSVLVGSNGMSNYHGLISTIQHRLSSSFSLLGNYTWSKCLSLTDAQGDYAGTNVQNPSNPAGDYGPCGSDYRNVENVVLIVQSKFPVTGFTALLVNNWVFAPLIHIQSGQPFTVTAGQDNSFTDVGNDRPNLIPGVPVYLHTAIRKGTGQAYRGYLNPAAFAQVTAGCPTPLSPATCAGYGTYGNLGRNGFRGPTNYQFDAQISRVFPIHESINATLRLEAFNVPNHPNFNIPTGGTSGTIGGPTGGAGVLTSTTFGQVSSTANQARIFQGSVKITF